MDIRLIKYIFDDINSLIFVTSWIYYKLQSPKPFPKNVIVEQCDFTSKVYMQFLYKLSLV